MKDIIEKKFLDSGGKISSQKLKLYLTDDIKKDIIQHTNFLNNNESIVQRIKCILFNITEYPRCTVCGNDIKRFTPNSYDVFYSFCSKKCADNKKNKNQYKNIDWGKRNKKTIETSLKKYGVESPNQSYIVKENQKRAIKEKYGVDNISQLGEVKNKVQKTREKRNHVYKSVTDIIYERALKNDWWWVYDKNKLQQLLEDYKHDVVKMSEKENIAYGTIRKACKRHNITINKTYKGAVKDLDNIENFVRDAKNENITRAELSKKYNIKSRYRLNRLLRENNINKKDTTSIRKELYKEVEGNKEKIFSMHYDDKKTLLDIKKELNFPLRYIGRLFKENNKDVRLYSYNKSKGELEVKDYINSLLSKNSCFSKKIKHNDKLYEVDCYVPEYNFGVEYCGEFWHSYNRGTDKKYHQDKFLWAKEQNISLLHIFEHEWILKNNIIKSMIKSRLGLSNDKIYARNCTVKEITSKESKEFFDNNHISGGIYAKINLGLFYNNILVSCISFSKPRFTKDIDYEMIRFASLLNTQIVGGLSKLWSFFINQYNPNSVITFADLRFGEGKSYEKIGFVFKETTSPNYWYFNIKYSYKLESRVKYQKHKLSKLLEDFDPNLTEYENMNNNDYLRIYDCGNNKYVWKKVS